MTSFLEQRYPQNRYLHILRPFLKHKRLNAPPFVGLCSLLDTFYTNVPSAGIVVGQDDEKKQDCRNYKTTERNRDRIIQDVFVELIDYVYVEDIYDEVYISFGSIVNYVVPFTQHSRYRDHFDFRDLLEPLQDYGLCGELISTQDLPPKPRKTIYCTTRMVLCKEIAVLHEFDYSMFMYIASCICDSTNTNRHVCDYERLKREHSSILDVHLSWLYIPFQHDTIFYLFIWNAPLHQLIFCGDNRILKTEHLRNEVSFFKSLCPSQTLTVRVATPSMDYKNIEAHSSIMMLHCLYTHVNTIPLRWETFDIFQFRLHLLTCVFNMNGEHDGGHRDEITYDVNMEK
jgi:hypothetical protein